MSFEAMTWAVKFELPVKQKIVLLMLANRINPDDGRCIPSIDRLARDCGMSKPSVKRALRELKEAGLIIVHERRNGSSCLSNQYELDISKNEGVGSHRPQGGVTQTPGVGSHRPPKQREETERGNREEEPDGSSTLLFSANSIPEKKGKTVEKKESPVEILQRIVREETARDFAAHRKAMRKPLTVEAARRLVTKLANHSDPDAVFDLSIENGWQGVFPDKAGGPRHGQNARESGADFARRIAERRAARRMGCGADQDAALPLLPADPADGPGRSRDG